MKGLQLAYEKATAEQGPDGKEGGGAGAGGSGAAADEAAALRKTVDRMIAEKKQLQVRGY